MCPSLVIHEGACSMSVSQHDWSLHRKGQIDQERHKEKIREAIKKNLGEIVSEESIILSDGTKRVRVPFAHSTNTVSALTLVNKNMLERAMGRVKSAMWWLRSPAPAKARRA